MHEAMGPFAPQGLDRPLALAAGPGPIAAVDAVPGGEPSRRPGETAGAGGAAIVGDPPARPGCPRPDPAARAQPGCGGDVATLVPRHIDMNEPDGVIGGDMHDVPTRARLQYLSRVPVAR